MSMHSSQGPSPGPFEQAYANATGVVAGSTVELVMAAGHAVRLVASEPDNLKLTTPDDLDLARRLVAAGT